VKVTVLTNVEKQGARTYEPVVNQVMRALKTHGYQVSIMGVHHDLKQLITGLRRRSPDLVFNLAETFGSDELGAVGLTGVLELMGIRFTGAGPGETYLQEDKSLTKKMLAFHGVPFPDFAVFRSDSTLEIGGKLRMPLFVKPLRMDASIGIDARSLVTNFSELMERIAEIHSQVHDAALAEEYIEGREFYVGILGNQPPLALPPVEMDFGGFPEDRPKIVDSKAKWDERSAEFKGTTAVIASIPDELTARLKKVALEAYRALRVRDYGRIDLRLTEEGEIYVIEVNANCHLENSSEFAMAAKAAGISYDDLIGRVADIAMARETAHIDHVRVRAVRRRSPRRAADVSHQHLSRLAATVPRGQ
jgi:D-alanine-D-alanine ligase